MLKQSILVNNHNYHLGNCLGSIVVAQQKKKTSISYWPASKIIIAVAASLRDEGFIQGFSLIKERHITQKIEIYLKYYSTSMMPLITQLTHYASPSRPYNCTYRRLWKLSRGSSYLFFLSTTRGIKTSEYCLSHVLGGNLLFKVR